VRPSSDQRTVASTVTFSHDPMVITFLMNTLSQHHTVPGPLLTRSQIQRGKTTCCVGIHAAILMSTRAHGTGECNIGSKLRNSRAARSTSHNTGDKHTCTYGTVNNCSLPGNCEDGNPTSHHTGDVVVAVASRALLHSHTECIRDQVQQFSTTRSLFNFTDDHIKLPQQLYNRSLIVGSHKNKAQRAAVLVAASRAVRRIDHHHRS